jgi:hypothetical protein
LSSDWIRKAGDDGEHRRLTRQHRVRARQRYMNRQHQEKCRHQQHRAGAEYLPNSAPVSRFGSRR